MIVVALRRPLSVIENEFTTIPQLIEIENALPSPGNPQNQLSRLIDLNEAKDYIGTDQMNSIAQRDEDVQLLGVVNECRASATDYVTESIHPSIFRLDEKIIDAAYLSLCGADMLINGDVSKPIGAGCQPVLIEINATPALRLHHLPSNGGHARNISGAILDEIFGRRALVRNRVAVKQQQTMRDDFAGIILDPEIFLSLSEVERDFNAKKVVH